MAEENLYAPPRAAVHDVADEEVGVQPVKLFSAKGRIGRLRLLAHLSGGYLLFAAVGMATALMGTALANGLQMVISIGLFGASVAFFAFIMLSTIKRCHDMDMGGWWCLASLIPVVGLYWFVKSGSPGANRFGAPPPPNTTGVKVLGFVFPVIMVIGIVAAIALPAYQGYTMRAKARQQGMQAPQVQPAR